MFKNIKRYILLFAVCLIAGCGGGGGSAGDTGSGTGPAVASFEVGLDKNTLDNSGQDTAILTVTALDANRNPVSGSQVTVSVDSGIYTADSSATDTTGKVTGKVSTGANKSNRNINVTVLVDSKTRSLSIPVTGSKISVSTTPAVPTPGATVTISAKVVDVNGNGIPSVNVVFSGNLGYAQTLTTNSSGNVQGVLQAAPSSPGTYNLVASAAGVEQQEQVRVLSSGTSGIPDAVGVISAANLSIVPNTIPPNATGSTTSIAGLRAVFQDSSNRAITNVRARFEIVAPGLGAGERISNDGTVVYSNANGEALADYIAGTRTSPTNGVIIRVCYGNTDASIANGACPNSRTATMTVANQPLAVTLGDDNKIITNNDSLTYIRRYDIAVADAAGNPVRNAPLSASVDLITYEKGSFALGSTAVCANEDINRNGFLDAGEDVNNNGAIEPRKADVIVYFPDGGAVTGANGRAIVLVEYSQSVATWLLYNLKITTAVAGSEGTVEKTYRTAALEADVQNGSFLVSPYGIGLCTERP